ncbi:hypothetical protein [Thermoflavimicrobium daqui]|jgi:hypothetical protein|uniref:hypothetical protein n=1 Tax=Thermoflavimicrobium daqui TaxID=2137476 RepID=UPI0011AB62E6|nr:hypothetical protein [Thermoflavimicrobium daqui]
MSKSLTVIEGGARAQEIEVVEYVPSSVMTVDDAKADLEKLYDVVKSVMRPKVDYDTIPGTPKPTLLKPGAERLLRFFGLGHRVECIEKVTDWEKPFFYFNYKVTIVKSYPTHEIVVAECEGSSNSKEKKYLKQDPYTIVNTLQKMAIKRALVGAVLQATGSSNLFTQDVEDMDLDRQPTKQKQQQYQSQQQAPRQKQSKPAQKQNKQLDRDSLMRKMHGKAAERGLSDKWIKAIISYYYKKDSRTKLTIEELQDLINKLEKTTNQELKEILSAVKSYFQSQTSSQQQQPEPEQEQPEPEQEQPEPEQEQQQTYDVNPETGEILTGPITDEELEELLAPSQGGEF